MKELYNIECAFYNQFWDMKGRDEWMKQIFARALSHAEGGSNRLPQHWYFSKLKTQLHNPIEQELWNKLFDDVIRESRTKAEQESWIYNTSNDNDDKRMVRPM